MTLSRRSWLNTTLAALASGTAVAQQTGHERSPEAFGHANHAMGPVGRVGKTQFDPYAFLGAWNFSNLPSPERERFYRETRRPDGSLLREYQFYSVDREIEIAPGMFFPAWTYNGQVPGPTLRCTEGDRVRVHFSNAGSHPHTMHFHGIHPSNMDGVFEIIQPRQTFIYEFDAEPFGLQLYHCHAIPLKRHIHKGLYGTFIIDPKQGRPPAKEMVMVMNGFDTNFDNDNEVYAVNTVGFHYQKHPIPLKLNEVIRIYLVNITEFDLINSFHIHGNFMKVFRTGTDLERYEYTDNLMLCQGERAVLEMSFKYPGKYMFHAHQSEFAELGWMGMFDVREDLNG
jgi:FtsP/CotA-like multicopper oxidase with cupredoxin domain